MDSLSSSGHLASLDVPNLVAMIIHLVDERSNLRGELATLRHHLHEQATLAAQHSEHVLTLSQNMASLRLSLHAILHLQHTASERRPSDEAHADDEEESILELYELRRWKAQFAVDQTRNLVDRLEELIAQVHQLERMNEEQKRDVSLYDRAPYLARSKKELSELIALALTLWLSALIGALAGLVIAESLAPVHTSCPTQTFPPVGQQRLLLPPTTRMMTHWLGYVVEYI